MAATFTEKFDSWLREQDSLALSIGSFRELTGNYFKEADLPPEELKTRLESLEKTVSELKGELLDVIRGYYDLHVTAESLITEDKKAKAEQEVDSVKAPEPLPKESTLHLEPAMGPVAEKAEEIEAEAVLAEAVPAEAERPDKGIIGYMNYVEWFYKQPPETQRKVSEIFLGDARFKERDLLVTEITFLPPKMASYLWQTANKLLAADYDDIATALLIKGLTIVTDKADKEMIHIIYAKYFYGKRKELKDAYMGCISHCEKAVKSYLSDKEPRNKPIAPFKLLTRIYEESGKYEKILEISGKAIELYEGSPSPERAEGFRKIREALSSQGIQ
jgi:hypothetical protein